MHYRLRVAHVFVYAEMIAEGKSPGWEALEAKLKQPLT